MQSEDLTTQDAPEKHVTETPIKSRRRGDSLEAAILEAAWDEMKAFGYFQTTMEGVAERAKTSKTVIYRRWPNRAELILAAMRHHGPVMDGEVPDTGELRADVLVLMRRMIRRMDDVGAETLHGLMVEFLSSVPMIIYLQGQQLSIETMMIILRHAAERGEVDLAKITPRIATLPFDLIRNEALLTHQPVPESVIIEIVDDIFLPLVLR